MEQKDLSILTQVVYKAHSEKNLVVDWEVVKHDTIELYKAVNEIQSKLGTPFNNKPASAPRGTKLPGDKCPDCGSEMSDSKYKPGTGFCYQCWAKNKKS